MKVVYSKESDTLRQMPQNYMLAAKHNEAWLVDPDMAINTELAIYAFKVIALIYRNKYQANGEFLADLLNKKIGG